ncbi:hypothetical protein BSKO_08501 [Bryopsis sp. KO-2023]|nr:hypothetical protein BSKO_08501 [Bryopsis sp. KO-2023]
MSSDGPALRGSGGSGGGGSYENSVREQDRFLPIANISRIMKKALPTNAKIAKDAKETVQECVSEFISFITSEASDKCQREKRKTINGEDLLWALSTLGFEEYVEPLKLFLQKHREFEGDKGSGMGKSAEDGKRDLGGSPSQLLEGQSQDVSLDYPLQSGSGLHHSPSPGRGNSSPNLLQ